MKFHVVRRRASVSTLQKIASKQHLQSVVLQDVIEVAGAA